MLSPQVYHKGKWWIWNTRLYRNVSFSIPVIIILFSCLNNNIHKARWKWNDIEPLFILQNSCTRCLSVTWSVYCVFTQLTTPTCCHLEVIREKQNKIANSDVGLGCVSIDKRERFSRRLAHFIQANSIQQNTESEGTKSLLQHQ